MRSQRREGPRGRPSNHAWRWSSSGGHSLRRSARRLRRRPRGRRRCWPNLVLRRSLRRDAKLTTSNGLRRRGPRSSLRWWRQHARLSGSRWRRGAAVNVGLESLRGNGVLGHRKRRHNGCWLGSVLVGGTLWAFGRGGQAGRIIPAGDVSSLSSGNGRWRSCGPIRRATRSRRRAEGGLRRRLSVRTHTVPLCLWLRRIATDWRVW